MKVKFFSSVSYKFFAAIAIVALVLAALPVTPAHAATLTVTSNAGGAVAVDGACTLREAIANANNDAATNVDCAAGTGNDTITFNVAIASPTITLGSSLPTITDVDGLTIDGTNLNGLGGTVTISGADTFRIVSNTAGTTGATFQDLILTNGVVNGDGAAINNTGNLIISNVTFTTNRTITGGGNDGGAIFHNTGTLSISNSTFTGNYTMDNGGAIYIAGGSGTMAINGSTFSTQNNAVIDDGAGIYLNAGTLTIDSTTFTSNATTNGGGGAIFQNGGTLTIGNTAASTFSGNTASVDGGAINVAGGTLTVNNTSFTNSTAANSAASGGAIYHNSATLLTVTNSTFTGNTATLAGGDGGAIRLDNNGSSATISGSTFTSNITNDEGGAIFNDGEPFTVTTSTFTSNVAGTGGASGADGGAIHNTANSTSATSKISLSSFINNSITMAADLTARGGAISNNGTIIIANVTFSGNSLTKSTAAGGDAFGGAVYANGVTTVHNATFSGNTVSESGTGTGLGGAIYSSGAGAMTIANSIVANGTENGAAGNCGGTFTNGGNNVEFNGGADCGFAITTNPNLGALTGSPQYFPLTSGSSAIDTGSNAICATATSTNNESQNGLTRPLDGNGDATATCDIGSYEGPAVGRLTLLKTVVNDNGGAAVDTAWTLTATGPTTISGIEGNAAVTSAFVTAGTYTLSESAVTGYTQTNLACVGAADTDPVAGGLAIATGETVTCTFTNNDNAPSLTLQKTVTNDNGGTNVPADWTLTATGPTGFSGAGPSVSNGASFDAGTYTLSESAVTGYTQTNLACVGAADTDPVAGGLSIALGETVTCTFTNNDDAPSLTLNKSVTNDNGGTNVPADWTLTATGPTGFSGAGPSVSNGASFDAGTYTLSESAVAGYTQTNLACVGAADTDPVAGGLSIALGETVTCTFTNNDNAPSLTLQKTVTNDNGGTNVPADWTLTATGPTGFSGAGPSVSNGASFDAGTYTLSESAVAGYTQTNLACVGAADTDPVAGGLSIALGESVTCTFTNNDDAANLTLVKVVVNDNGGTSVVGDWTLTADGTGFTSGVSQSVNAGTYTLAESGPAGYTASAWVCVGGNQAGADITLALGESATCTITNDDDAASLTLVKVVTNDNGGTNVVGDWTLTADGTGFTSGVSQSVNAGTYTLAESGPAGYTASAWVCVGGNQAGADITLALGESATCTITNDDDVASLTLVKVVINDDSGTNVVADWTLTADGTGFTSGVSQSVDAGTYTLAESGPAGYTASAWVCVGGSQAGADITLGSGESATCTITNDDDPTSLTLVKVVTNDNGGTNVVADWTLTADGTGFTSGVTQDVIPGTYTLAESGPAGYTASAWVCVGGTQVGADITLANAETATCTITNDDDAASLTLVKVVTNDNGGTSVVADWTLTADGTGFTSGVSQSVNAGTYTLAESGPAGYTASAWVCVGGAQVGADITLANAESATCTITNDDVVASLTLEKVVINDNGGPAVDADWILSASGPTNISGVEGDASITNAGVSAGNYTLSESGPANYTQTSLACNGAADIDPSDGLTIAVGENVTCTFTNDDDVVPLLVTVINSNPATAGASIVENESIPDTLGVTQLTVQFNKNVDDPALDTGADDVTNPANYILLRSATNVFQTPGCGGAVVTPDVSIAVNSVTYSNGAGAGPFVATLAINGGLPLNVAGFYRLYVCGTTSIVEAFDPLVALSGDGTTAGTDFRRNFRITSSAVTTTGGALIPATGFPQNKVTALPIQPADKAYASTDLWLEIPKLGVKLSIIGVPKTKDGWDVTWLNKDAGWLNGSAFPTWTGNSVLTAHVWDALNKPGPFAGLKGLKYGDQVIVHAFGQVYTYEIQESKTVSAASISTVFKHEEKSWLTLVTCEDYQEQSNTYSYRRMVRAVLVSVAKEK